MQTLHLLFVVLLSTSAVRAFWWSSSQSSEPPVTKQVQYVRAFTYQPVAFPAHSLLAPPSPYKFVQTNPANLVPNSIPMGKQVGPVQTSAHQQTQQPQTSSPFSSFFSSTFGSGGQSSSSVQPHPNAVPQYPPQSPQQQQQQQQQLQQQQQQQQQHQQQQQQQQPPPVQQQMAPLGTVAPVPPSVQSDMPSPHHVSASSVPSAPGMSFYGQSQQQQPVQGGKYPYFTMDQVQYLSSLPASAPHAPQVQFVPCMCPIAVNVQSHVTEPQRLDDTTTTDSEVVVPSADSEQ